MFCSKICGMIFNIDMCHSHSVKSISKDADKNTNSHKVSELKFSQKEIDTPVLHVCKTQNGYKSARIRPPDSDIFFICLYYAKTELESLNVFIDTETATAHD